MDTQHHFNEKDLLAAERLLYASLAMFMGFLGMVGYAFLKDSELGQTLLGSFAAHILGGRAAGVGLCIAFDVNLVLTILYNMFLEVLIVIFTFSIFLFSFNNSYFRFGFLQKAIRNSARNAIKYEAVISRYGWIGIFAFVMIPLPMTGPVVGSFLAYFLNFSLKKNFITVFSGTFVAIVIWSFFFEFLSVHITKIQGVLAVIAIVIGVYFLKHIRNWFSKAE
ncbi:MAG: hypothetical protein COX19_02160 [Desulfobacterales bacterium CG23_combo_of_CG06-09_8_20_14_all_51_8]|nr:MAG: hypothetical protein COX19_02160 [Desulfobacterales bacterium CG23_combo_of_CG06-09_8_20_14_all_51_8]